MTPKEKAIDLFDKLYVVPNLSGNCIMNKHMAKQCAIIAVDEILQATKTSYLKMKSNTLERTDIYKKYWQQVKTELTNL